MFTEEEKKLLLKSIAGLTKKYQGAGPKSHYVKYYDREIHIVMKGTLSSTEIYLVKTFGQEYIDAVQKFYILTVAEAVSQLDQIFMGKYQMQLLACEPDFINDQVVFKIKHR
ncbi:Na-translocating system protein MpsC family protein [Acetobacterium bakii]|uniref:Na+-translocating membrane potential-generating system MpsC domain-containing protein n=1 Tax=Acetobacterium bakii TaxID=52689 RepID=A0A0L6TXQ8_9FIRM|nr:Na-translocating system protein MpsC family protein [Acetobacterium bakii]KNZ40340.1 hypothetical protein AKG39_18295 [Acetobacterium bakii]